MSEASPAELADLKVCARAHGWRCLVMSATSVRFERGRIKVSVVIDSMPLPEESLFYLLYDFGLGRYEYYYAGYYHYDPGPYFAVADGGDMTLHDICRGWLEGHPPPVPRTHTCRGPSTPG